MDREYLLSLVEKYNSPLYVYDAEKIEGQYKRITDAFSSVKHLKINYGSVIAGRSLTSSQRSVPNRLG